MKEISRDEAERLLALRQCTQGKPARRGGPFDSAQDRRGTPPTEKQPTRSPVEAGSVHVRGRRPADLSGAQTARPANPSGMQKTRCHKTRPAFPTQGVGTQKARKAAVPQTRPGRKRRATKARACRAEDPGATLKSSIDPTLAFREGDQKR